MQRKFRNRIAIAGVTSVALAGTLVATSLALGGNDSEPAVRIAPRAQTIVVQPHPKRTLVSHGDEFAWRVDGDEGASFR